MTKKDPWPGAFAAYGTVFRQIKKNPEPALLYIGGYTLFTIVSLVLQGQTSATQHGHVLYEDVAVFIFLLALPVYGLAVADRRAIGIAEFMRFDLKKYLTLVAVTVLVILIVGASLLLFFFFAIWTLAWFSVANYAAVDKRLGPINALKESKRLARAHLSKVWGLFGTSILLNVPMFLLLHVPYIGIAVYQFFTLLTLSAFAVLYRWLQHNH